MQRISALAHIIWLRRALPVCRLSLLSGSSWSRGDDVDRPVSGASERRNVSQDKDLINTLNHNEIVASSAYIHQEPFYY